MHSSCEGGHAQAHGSGRKAAGDRRSAGRRWADCSPKLHEPDRSSTRPLRSIRPARCHARCEWRPCLSHGSDQAGGSTDSRRRCTSRSAQVGSLTSDASASSVRSSVEAVTRSSVDVVTSMAARSGSTEPSDSSAFRFARATSRSSGSTACVFHRPNASRPPAATRHGRRASRSAICCLGRPHCPATKS